MEYLTTSAALILAVVEGITEFLPISSTGHMILVGELMHVPHEKASTFEIVIQLGAIAAVAILYRSRFFDLFKKGEGFVGKRALIAIALSILPTLIVGKLFYSKIKAYLFHPIPVASALLIGGIILILIERLWKRGREGSLEEITHKQSFAVGCFQCLSLWPGTSRAAATIIGGMLSGLSRSAAAEFSFLVAVPLMGIATVYELYKSAGSFVSEDLVPFSVGFGVSFVVAMIAIKIFVGFIKRHSFEVFGWYRIILGALVLLFWKG